MFLRTWKQVRSFFIDFEHKKCYNTNVHIDKYNFHMYAWAGLKGWFGGSGILGTLAGAASEANVESNDPFYDYNYYIEKGDAFNAYLRTALYLAVGVLGL